MSHVRLLAMKEIRVRPTERRLHRRLLRSPSIFERQKRRGVRPVKDPSPDGKWGE
jgi:hypothetical protein